MPMEVRPLSEALGAEVTGIDVSRLDDAMFDKVADVFNRSGVTVFRDQHLTPEQQIAFSRRFGEVQFHVSNDLYHKDHNEIVVLSNRAPDGTILSTVAAGDYWHSDMSYVPRPPLGSMLYALEVPEIGGDTEWANMYTAYETLPEATRKRIAGLRGIHTFNRLKNPRVKVPEAYRNDPERYARQSPPDQIHPLVRTHVVTGRKALYVSLRFTVGIEGMDDAEAQPLLEELFAHQTRREFIYHHKWRLGDLLFWDNRCTIHLACGGIKPPGVRYMHRTTVMGDVPA